MKSGLTKADKDFLRKIAKKADDAYAIAKRIGEQDREIRIDSEALKVGNSKTTTFVRFSTKTELNRHTPAIQELTQNIDRLCKTMKLRELRVEHKNL